MPISWDELSEVKAGEQWNVRNAHPRLDKGNDPWTAYVKSARSLAAAMKKTDFVPPK